MTINCAEYIPEVDRMGTPGATEGEPDSGYGRLETQISWYDSKSGEAQSRYGMSMTTLILVFMMGH